MIPGSDTTHLTPVAGGHAGAWLRALRPAQWIKNGVLFAGVVFGGKLLDPPALAQASLAFVIFCLVSSGFYLINDVVDRQADLRHPIKRRRPVAAGEIPATRALAVGILLVAGGLVCSFSLGAPFLLAVLTYVLLMTAYNLWLKRLVIVDVFTIAAGFVVRAAAGAIAVGVVISPWLLICTMLRIAGVTAYPVITNLENFRGDEDITLPMPAHFNHAIAHVEYSDGTSQFVDGTATYNGIDELGSGDRGANCIIVRPEGGERVQIPWGTAEDDSQTDEIDAEFAAGGTLKLSVTRTAVGDSSSILRAQFEREGDRKKRLELEWSEHYPGAKVGNIVVNDLSDLDVQPKLTFTVELPNAYATKDGRIEFRTALDPREWTQTSFGSLTTRKTDLLTPAPYERISIVHYKLPAGDEAPWRWNVEPIHEGWSA